MNEDSITGSDYPLFQLGATGEELNEYFNKIGHILTILLNTKLNNNLLTILYRLKPITTIDEFMLKFNFDKEVALRQNEDLAIVVEFWLKDSIEMRAESETALENVVKTEEFIKLLNKQENDLLALVNNAIESIRQPMKNQTEDTTNSMPTKASNENFPEVKSELILTIKSHNQIEDMSYSSAMAIIKQTRDRYEKRLYACNCLYRCLEALLTINENNKQVISRWDLTEEAIKLRSEVWVGRKELDKNRKQK